jgi:hypothetical protein
MSTTFTATAKATDAEGHSGTKTAPFTVATGAPSLKLGIDFEPSAGTNAPFEPSAQIGRVFVNAGVTDIHQEPEFVRAYAAGCRVFIFSWKDTSTGTIEQALATIPADVYWYGAAHHEPEDMTAATFKALQADHMPMVDEAGGEPTAIFTSFSLNNPNNTSFHLSDWKCPAGTHRVLGADYYPDKESAFTQAQKVPHWQSAMATWGVSRFLFPEYGIVQGVSNAVSQVQAFRGIIASGWGVEGACWWSNQKAGKPNYRLTTTTAAAFFS